MATQSRLVFINLPIKDVDASRAFFGELGFEFDPKFSDATTACMVLSEQAWVMLIEQDRFADFTTRPTADANASTEAIIAVSADSREGVDALADAALGAGATPAKEPMEMGFMYGRSFHDLDGHHWEVMWMDAKAVENGPADMAQTA